MGLLPTKAGNLELCMSPGIRASTIHWPKPVAMKAWNSLLPTIHNAI